MKAKVTQKYYDKKKRNRKYQANTNASKYESNIHQAESDKPKREK